MTKKKTGNIKVSEKTGQRLQFEKIKNSYKTIEEAIKVLIEHGKDK